MKKGVFILFNIILGNLLVAQNDIKFSKAYTVIPGFPYCLTSSIIISNNGYVVYCGTRDSASPYPLRVSIIKVDTIGNLLWSKSYGKPGLQYYSAEAYGGGGVSVPWGGYAGTGWVTNDSGTWSDPVLFRFDNNGDTIWSKTYKDTAQIQCTALKITRDKKYIMGGQWVENSGFNTVTLIKADSSGNKLWQKTYKNASPEVLVGLDTCRDGGFIWSSYDNYAYLPLYTHVIKTDSLGNVQWSHTMPDSAYGATGDDITSLKNGGYLLAGLDYISNIYPYPTELFLVKLSSSGAVKWYKLYKDFIPSNYGGVLFTPRELNDGNIIACGSASDYNNNTWGVIIKVDSNGNKLWLRNYSMQQPAEQDYLNDIRPTPDGGFVSCGFTYGSAENVWVIKTDSLGCADSGGCDYTGVAQLTIKSGQCTIYPNPNDGVFTLQVNSEKVKVKSEVEICNMMGEQIKSEELRGKSTAIDISNQSSGIYLYRVTSEDGKLVGEGKFIIEK